MTHTYAIFDKDGNIQYVSSKCDSAEQCKKFFVSILPSMTKWPWFEQQGWYAKAVTVCDPERLEKVLAACDELGGVASNEQFCSVTRKVLQALADFRASAAAEVAK